MKNLLNVFCLLLLLLATTAISFDGFTQTPKPKNDIIVKTDDSQISCRVVAVGLEEVIYRNAKGDINRINKTLVQRVLYANGSVVDISPAKASANSPSKPSPQPEISQQPRPDQQPELTQILRDIENNRSVANRKIRLRILFETGSANIQPQSLAYLDSIALFLVKIPTVLVEINGFTDNTGNALSNLTLSQTRANAVKDYLTNALNAPETRIKSVGYGPVAPIAPNTTNAGRALNRRVELKFLGLSNETYTLQFRNKRRLQIIFMVSSADNQTLSYKENANAPLQKVPVSQVEFIEYPDGTRRKVGSTSIITADVAPNPKIENKPTEEESVVKPPTRPITQPTSTRKRIAVQLNFLPVYMLGDTAYTSLNGGYGHTIGLGGSAQFDYGLAKWISVGAEVGYLTWRTNVKVVENKGDTPYRDYTTQTNQAFLLAHVSIKLGQHFYVMPQGGINYLVVKDDRATGEVPKSFQTSYGGTIGYLIEFSPSVHLNAGLFYRTSMANKTTNINPTQYAGFRLGLQFSR